MKRNTKLQETGSPQKRQRANNDGQLEERKPAAMTDAEKKAQLALTDGTGTLK